MRCASLRRTFAALAIAFAAKAPAAPLDLVPDAIVGKNSFSEVFTGVSATQLGVPGGLAEDPATGELWVADGAHRVLRFPSAAAYTAGQPANLVLGQADFTSSQPNRGGAVGANTLKDPRGVGVNQVGYVYVSDSGNNRVLVFRPPFANGMNASLVLGQADFTQGAAGATTSRMSFPTALTLDPAGNLFVVDLLNKRVLRFRAPHTNAIAAEYEFKNVTATGSPERFTLDQPTGVAIDAAGGLWIADFGLNRVVRHPNALTTGTPLPSTVLCQANFLGTASGSTLSTCTNPVGLAMDAEGSIYVADSLGRVMRFPANPANGAAATEAVVGNGFFCDQVVPSTLPCAVRSVMVDRRGNLHVADSHARVMRYDLPRARVAPGVASLSPNTAPVGTAFQLTVNGSGFDAGATVIWDGQPRPTQFISPGRLVAQIPAGDPAGVFGYAVAVVNPAPGGGASAPLTFTPYVRGRLDNLADRFLLAPGFDDTDPSRVGEERYGPVNAFVAAGGDGSTLAIQPGTGRLFLSDPAHSRILSWPSAPGLRNLDAADLILGQPDEFATACNRGSNAPDASTLCSPGAMAFDAAGSLYVADVGNNRVLKYAAPFSTGMAASVVFGQAGSFTTRGSNQGADPAGHLSFPAAVAVNAGALWVHDGGNRRIRRYSNPDQVQLADLDIGTPTQPCPPDKFCLPATFLGSMAFDSGGRLHAVSGSTVRRFSPPFQAEQLPDVTLVAGGPTGPALGFKLQAAIDPSGALLVSDAVNSRVLRYEPPFSDASVASQVLGQPDFTTIGGVPSRSRTGPALSVTSDAQGNVYTFDGARLLAFDTPFAPAGSGADFDNDGIPNGLEASEGRDPWTKDNDVFTNPRLFAMQQYRDFLSREGDATGVSFWSGAVGNGSIGRSAMIESFFNSGEFQGTISPVARLYFAYFLRIPDYSGLNFWIGYYKAGNTLASVSQNFALSPEFTSRYGALNNSQFVDLVYQNVLGRAPDAGGKAFWQGQLDSGAQTRGQVMVGFSESDEYKLASFNKVYVTMMYTGMLRRSPDQGGFDFWVNYKNQGNSGLALIDGFLASNEYRARFLP